ncbi:bacterioferritin [Parabacteroides sp. 52]|uniref:ferritin-like domain-containing protein n=1 Tax=unclassified Parabacteroides TaxID=2649774 RepID=UPI0013D8D1D2|nr:MULTISPECIES: ferritin-like domain-containing protein [unclassified Parabacteroides]MDH6533858.1 bacterioferritin [Parabacteroides sp. PM5-20]NDV54604.1 bacterioferritin [Parabacteroides sp. 52]
MINREKSIELLNKAVAEEMTAVNQYMYFHILLEDMGYDYLAAYFKRTSIKEMIHVEKFAERILYLKGDLDLKASKRVEKIKEVKAMLELANQMELSSIEHYNEWAKICGAESDSASKKLFESIILEEEEHQDQFDTEIDNMNNFGDNYLALQSIAHSKQAAKGE